MPITALPTPPNRQDPSTFDDRADAFLGALPQFGEEANELAAEINATKQSILDVCVEETDVGFNPNQVPKNQDLGGMAFQSPEAVVLRPPASSVPFFNGDVVFQLTSNTELTVKVRGTDGVVRSTTFTLS